MGIILDVRREKYKDVWLEKYRPGDMSEIVIEPNYGKKFNEFIGDDQIPSILLVGPPGTGKTTMAYILIDKLIKDDMDFLELNGSLFRGIEVVRQLDGFVKSETMFSRKKIIFIDEADKLTPDAQDALRNVVEQNADHLSFIFTANYSFKIIDALKSRLQTYTFKSLPKEFVRNTIYGILGKELIQYQKPDVDYIIDSTYPDMRRALNEINKVVYLEDSQKLLSLNNADEDFLIEQKFVDAMARLQKTKGTTSFGGDIKVCYDYVYKDTMDYLDAFSKMNMMFGNIKIKTLSAKFYNEVGKCISPKFLMLEFIGEFLNVILKG